MIMGPCYVIMGPLNENTGPWNVVMGQCNVIIGPWNVNRGPWDVIMGTRIVNRDREM